MHFILCFLIGTAVRFFFKRRRKNAWFNGRKLHALMLAAPMVEASGFTLFYARSTDHIAPSTEQRLRPALLHRLGLNTSATDDKVRESVAHTLTSGWYMHDLDSVRPGDDPIAALAFAVVRTAFLTRSAMLLGWIEAEDAWRVLLLNAQRAQECFGGWEALGRAYLIGRRQWISSARADPFGSGFDEATLSRLLLNRRSGWARVRWNKQRAFEPFARVAFNSFLSF